MITMKPVTVIKILAAIISFSCIYIFAPWQAAVYYLSPNQPSVQAQLDDAIRQGLDGIVVYSHKKGEKPKLYASGWHNREQKIPAAPNALFKIASIGKLYKAAAVTKLVANGKLSLDKTLADYLPSLKGRIEYSDQITLKMMVMHRSGIPNYTDHPKFNWGESSVGRESNLTLALDIPADFKPDSDYGYSNTNYLLLDNIITKVLGYSQNQFIKDELLTPLGLEQTFFSVNEVAPSELMSGYHIDYPNDFKELDQGYVANAADVGIFLRALNDGTLLTKQEQEIYSSIYKYEHTGWVLGYYSIARYHQNIDTVIIQFVNTVGGNTLTLTDVIYDKVVDILKEENE